MPDVFANLAEASPQVPEMIANVLELRASIPQQQEMLRAYLRDVAFQANARVHGVDPRSRPRGNAGRGSSIIASGRVSSVCDGDFSTATLSTGAFDPLQACVHAFVEAFVNDRWMVRRMSGLATKAGFEVSPLRGAMASWRP